MVKRLKTDKAKPQTKNDGSESLKVALCLLAIVIIVFIWFLIKMFLTPPEACYETCTIVNITHQSDLDQYNCSASVRRTSAGRLKPKAKRRVKPHMLGMVGRRGGTERIREGVFELLGADLKMDRRIAGCFGAKGSLQDMIRGRSLI
jgi:hypothetical protein